MTLLPCQSPEPGLVAEHALELLASELRVDQLLGGLRRAVLPGLRPALGLRDHARRARGALGLLRLGAELLRELVVDLADGGVDERPRPVDDLDRLRARELGARRALAARRGLVGRLVARQA